MDEHPTKHEFCRINTDRFRRALYRACDHVGIKRKSLHKIRKTYASILLDNGVSEKMVIENMGHTDISITRQCYSRKRRTEIQRLKVIDGIKEFQDVASITLVAK